LEGILANCKIK